MATLDGYSKQFASRYPGTGEITSGSVVNRQQARELGEVFSTKLTELSRKETLSEAEATLVDQTVDLGSRSIIWCIQNKGMALPGDASVKTLKSNAFNILHNTPQAWPLEASGDGSQALLAAINPLTGGVVSMRTNPAIRGACEDYASAVMPFLGEMVAENGRLIVDNYLAGNLQNLLAHYEMVEAQAPAF